MATPFKMKGNPMKRNFGIGASPMKDVTTWEKIKAGVKGVGAGISRALKASRTEGVGYSTKEGIKAGKKARKKALKEYDND